MAGDTVAGPSGGVLGNDAGLVGRDLIVKHSELARQFVSIGRHKRAGHDRKRWETVNWDDYRAHVPVGRSGPWRAGPVSSLPDSPEAILSNWVAEAEGLPPAPPGLNMALIHDQRGLVMSDVPAEIAGALPFLDAMAARARSRVLIAGLGLGIVPAWLLVNARVARIDIVEIDPHVIELITRDAGEPGAPNRWAADPRLHIWTGDAHTWWGFFALRGCALHDRCLGPDRFDGAFFDIWDTVSPGNLPSMHRLHRRFARQVDGRMWSWERPECEAMRARGQTLPRPCLIASETGYELEYP
jgi:hypothetical protein